MSLFSTNASAPSWYVFDKIYANKRAMDDGYDKDGVLLGRYVLVRYSEYNFTEDEESLLYRVMLAQVQANGGNLVDAGGLSRDDYNAYKSLNQDWPDTQGRAGVYVGNLKKDLIDSGFHKSYDRIFFRKGPNGYEEMDSLVIPEDLKQLGDTVTEAENNINSALQDIEKFKEDLMKDIKEEGGDIDIAAEVEEQVNTKLAAMVDTF